MFSAPLNEIEWKRQQSSEQDRPTETGEKKRIVELIRVNLRKGGSVRSANRRKAMYLENNVTFAQMKNLVETFLLRFSVWCVRMTAQPNKRESKRCFYLLRTQFQLSMR